MEKIKKTYKEDPMIQKLAKIEENSVAQKPAERDPNIIREKEGIILYWGLIYVPAKLYKQLVKEIHKAPAHGYQEINKTIE